MTSQFIATVRDLSHKGLGVVDHPDGKVFFVPGVWPGDAGEFETVTQKKRYGFARLITLQTPSPDRVSVPCPYQGFDEKKCGGCAWMIASYESQLKHKGHIIRHSLERAGIQTEIFPILASPKIFHYRNRAQLKTNGEALGFVGTKSNHLVDIQSCMILNEKCDVIFQSLRAQLPKKEWEPSRGYDWNYIDIDDEQDKDGIQLNRRLSFRQGNPEQNVQMKRWLFEQVSCDKISTAVELFCGSGNFTEDIVRAKIEKILAFDISVIAIDNLKKNWPSVKAGRCDLYCDDPETILGTQNQTDVLVLDPPREGFERLSAWVQAMPGLKKIVYLSCDVQTLIRDISPLLKSSWALTHVQPIDLFPHTPHTELMGVMIPVR